MNGFVGFLIIEISIGQQLHIMVMEFGKLMLPVTTGLSSADSLFYYI
jgi:hypothetical protein